MPKITFSLDYDGCSCILFGTTRQQILRTTPGELIEVTKTILDVAKEVFSETLDALRAGHEGVPEVFCGSNRQSRWLDNIVKQNPTGAEGSALDLLRDYCIEKHWLFNPFLLADKYLTEEDGYSFDKPDATSDPSISNGMRTKLNEWDPAKTEILAEQIYRAASISPTTMVDFYFIDDDYHERIIPGLKSFFSTNPDALPPNVRLHFIKYDWQVLLLDTPPHLVTSRKEWKALANGLMRPQGVIQRCDEGVGDARTEEAAFKVAILPESSMDVVAAEAAKAAPPAKAMVADLHCAFFSESNTGQVLNEEKERPFAPGTLVKY